MEFLKKHAAWFVSIMLIVFIAVSVRLAWDDSTTMDEKAHIPASWSYMNYFDMRINPEHPPLIKDLSGISMLMAIPEASFPVPSKLWDRGDENVLPSDHPEGSAKSWGLAQWEFGDRFLFQEGNDPGFVTFAARLPIILIAALLGYMIFRWTRELSGTLAGLFAMLLFVADPNVLGHNHLVTTDIGIAAFIFLSVYFFVRFLKNPSWTNTVVSGAFLGLANLAKFSAVTLFPLFGLIAILFALTLSLSEDSNQNESLIRRRIMTVFSYLFKYSMSVIVCFAVIWALYIPNTWDMPVDVVQEIARAQFPNDRLIGRLAESTVITLSDIPGLKPLAHYLTGVFMVFARVAGGNTYFFLGTVSNHATPIYFPFVFLMKSTVPLLGILAFSLIYGIWRLLKGSRHGRSAGRTLWEIVSRSFQVHIAEYSMLSFVLLYSYLSITGNLNIGFRHLFPIIPFLMTLGTMSVFSYWRRHHSNTTTSAIVRTKLFLIVFWVILIPAFAYPSYISYFNTAFGGHREGYRYVTDSNYDWGQDVKRLKSWIDTYNFCTSEHRESADKCRTLMGERTFPTDGPIEKIRVDYFGGSSPEYYLGNLYESWHSNNAPEPGWYAVSAGFYQESIHRRDQMPGSINYSWLPMDSLIGRAGDSIFIFYVGEDRVPHATSEEQSASNTFEP